MLFDYLVVGQVFAINPAHAVRGPKHVVKRGKTPVLVADDARSLLNSIPVTRKVKQPDGSEVDVPDLVGLRDRALIAVMTYALARIGAVVGMRVEDYYPVGKRWWVRLHEKGGKRHEMPAHHSLETYLDEYIAAAGIRDDAKTPLFRSTVRRGDALTASPMHRIDAYRMVRRRTAAAGSSKGSAATCSARPASRLILKAAGRSRTHRRWRPTKVRARPNSMTAPATRSRSMRSSGSRFDLEKVGPAVQSGPFSSALGRRLGAESGRSLEDDHGRHKSTRSGRSVN